jgi:hypothetical protein
VLYTLGRMIPRCFLTPWWGGGAGGTRVDRAWIRLFKITYDELLSNFALNFNPRPYTMDGLVDLADEHDDDADSQDSNREDAQGADYPDEESEDSEESWDDDDDDDDDDGEQRPRRRNGAGDNTAGLFSSAGRYGGGRGAGCDDDGFDGFASAPARREATYRETAYDPDYDEVNDDNYYD